MNEFRAALQDLTNWVRANVSVSVDHACNRCTSDPLQWPSIPKDWLCPYHAAKALLARPEPRIIDAGTSYESVPGIAYPRMKPRTVPVDDDEPEPRITREEAEKLLTEFAACVAKDATGPSMDNERRLKEAFEACLAAMLRPEPAPSVRPDPQTKTLYVFLQQRPRDKQPFPLVYVDQQLAEAAPHRVTPVVAVDVPMLPSAPAASDGEKA